MNLYYELTQDNEPDENLNELLNGLTVNEFGVITTAGKFEGESIATVYFYNEYLNGGETVFEVTESERELLNVDSEYSFVYLAESESGFVSLEWYRTQAEAEQAESESLIDWS